METTLKELVNKYYNIMEALSNNSCNIVFAKTQAILCVQEIYEYYEEALEEGLKEALKLIKNI